MIRVTIELLPHGSEEKKTTLGVVEIANDITGSDARGNYNVRLTKKGGDCLWKRGRVVGFPRKRLGAYDLLYRALRECVGYRNGEG